MQESPSSNSNSPFSQEISPEHVSPRLLMGQPFYNGVPFVEQQFIAVPTEFGDEYVSFRAQYPTDQILMDPRFGRFVPSRRGNKQSWKKGGRKKKQIDEKVDLHDITSWPTLNEAKVREQKEKENENKDHESNNETTVEETDKTGVSTDEDHKENKKKGVNWVPLKDIVPITSQYSSGRGRGRRKEGKWRPNFRGRRGIGGTRPYSRNYSYGGVFPEMDLTQVQVYPVLLEEDYLIEPLLKQIEYYFSVENLCKDIFLRNQMDEEGWVPLSVIANFNRVKALTTNYQLISQIVQDSDAIEFNNDKIRKKNDWKTWLLPKMDKDNKDENENKNYNAVLDDETEETNQVSVNQTQQPNLELVKPESINSIKNEDTTESETAPSIGRNSMNWVDKVKKGNENAKQNSQVNGDSSRKHTELSENEGEWITATRGKRKGAKGKKIEREKSNRDSKKESSGHSIMRPANGTDYKSKNQNRRDENIIPRLMILTRDTEELTKDLTEEGIISTLHDGILFFEREILGSFKDIPFQQNSLRFFQANPLIGWFYSHPNSKEIRELPSFEHPASILLKRNGFFAIPYSNFREKCLQDRNKGVSFNMENLFSFWSYFLIKYFDKSMYAEFKEMAVEDAKRNRRYGLQRLCDFYSNIFKNNMNTELIEDLRSLTKENLENSIVMETLCEKLGNLKLKPELDALLSNRNSNQKIETNLKSPEIHPFTAEKKANPWFQNRSN